MDASIPTSGGAPINNVRPSADRLFTHPSSLNKDNALLSQAHTSNLAPLTRHLVCFPEIGPSMEAVLSISFGGKKKGTAKIWCGDRALIPCFATGFIGST